jgi:tetratricopeptide (TPR) repeat protein
MDMTFGEVGAACKHAILTSRCGDTRLGLALAQQAYRQARSIGTPEALLEGLNALALCQATSGCYIESVACAIDAFRLARQHNNRFGALYALTSLFAASNHLLETGGATLTMVDRAIVAASKLGDPALVVRLRNLRGVILGSLNRFDEGEKELLLALSEGQKADRTTPASMIVGNLANLAARQAVFATAELRESAVRNAERRFADALEIAVAEKSAEAEIRAWFNCGLLRAGQDDLPSACEAFQRSIDLALKLKHQARAIDGRIELGGVLARMSRCDEAIQALELAFADADAMRPSKQLSAASDQLAAIYRVLGRERESANAKVTAERERAEFQRERENAGRELRMFWREFDEFLNTPQ